MKTHVRDVPIDLGWIDMLKGIAIIGVFLDNVTSYMKAHVRLVGPFVHVFFILSGFGLAIGYLGQGRANWSWKRWAWRRTTKIVVPYELLVLFSFALGMLGLRLYESVDMQFSWGALATYLTFTRNFFRFSWVWNPPLWFMPAIVGLYISFPVLLKILEKWGPWALLLISALVTYGTRTIAVLVDAPQSHGADLFTFWMFQFAFGILLAYIRKTDPPKLCRLIGLQAFLLGIGLMACSWALLTYVPLGAAFNDPITSVGIFLVLLNLVWAGRALVPTTGNVLTALSSKSYLMYLMHYPIMSFLIGPPLRAFFTNQIVALAFGIVYVAAMFFLACLVDPAIDKLASWAYSKYRVN